jgi:hypothetical protein
MKVLNFNFFLLSIGLYLIFESIMLGFGRINKFGPGLLPFCLAFFYSILLILLMIKSHEKYQRIDYKSIFFIITSTIIFYLFLNQINTFMLLTVVMVLLQISLDQKKIKSKNFIIYLIFMNVIIYVIFKLLLQIQLPF